MENSLKEQLVLLAATRKAHQEKKAELDALREAFNAQHAELVAEVDRLSGVQKESEETCRNLGLVVFHTTGNKKPFEGVEVKLWDVAAFNATEAEQWCRVNMPALLILNGKAYEKVLRERANSETLKAVLPDMPGDVTEEPKTSLGRDLSQYLPTPEETTAS